MLTGNCMFRNNKRFEMIRQVLSKRIFPAPQITRTRWSNPVAGQVLQWLYFAVRILLAIVFIYAGLAKLTDIRAFAGLMSEYGLLPRYLLLPAAIGLPLAELIAGVGLLLEVRGSLSAITAMLLMFAAVLWFGILQGLDVDCGCFSAEELAGHDALRSALYRDIGLMAVAAYLYWWRLRHWGSIAPVHR